MPDLSDLRRNLPRGYRLEKTFGGALKGSETELFEALTPGGEYIGTFETPDEAAGAIQRHAGTYDPVKERYEGMLREYQNRLRRSTAPTVAELRKGIEETGRKIDRFLEDPEGAIGIVPMRQERRKVDRRDVDAFGSPFNQAVQDVSSSSVQLSSAASNLLGAQVSQSFRRTIAEFREQGYKRPELFLEPQIRRSQLLAMLPKEQSKELYEVLSTSEDAVRQERGGFRPRISTLRQTIENPVRKQIISQALDRPLDVSSTVEGMFETSIRQSGRRPTQGRFQQIREGSELFAYESLAVQQAGFSPEDIQHLSGVGTVRQAQELIGRHGLSGIRAFAATRELPDPGDPSMGRGDFLEDVQEASLGLLESTSRYEPYLLGRTKEGKETFRDTTADIFFMQQGAARVFARQQQSFREVSVGIDDDAIRKIKFRGSQSNRLFDRLRQITPREGLPLPGLFSRSGGIRDLDIDDPDIESGVIRRGGELSEFSTFRVEKRRSGFFILPPEGDVSQVRLRRGDIAFLEGQEELPKNLQAALSQAVKYPPSLGGDFDEAGELEASASLDVLRPTSRVFAFDKPQVRQEGAGPRVIRYGGRFVETEARSYEEFPEYEKFYAPESIGGERPVRERDVPTYLNRRLIGRGRRSQPMMGPAIDPVTVGRRSGEFISRFGGPSSGTVRTSFERPVSLLESDPEGELLEEVGQKDFIMSFSPEQRRAALSNLGLRAPEGHLRMGTFERQQLGFKLREMYGGGAGTVTELADLALETEERAETIRLNVPQRQVDLGFSGLYGQRLARGGFKARFSDVRGRFKEQYLRSIRAFEQDFPEIKNPEFLPLDQAMQLSFDPGAPTALKEAAQRRLATIEAARSSNISLAQRGSAAEAALRQGLISEGQVGEYVDLLEGFEGGRFPAPQRFESGLSLGPYQLRGAGYSDPRQVFSFLKRHGISPTSIPNRLLISAPHEEMRFLLGKDGKVQAELEAGETFSGPRHVEPSGTSMVGAQVAAGRMGMEIVGFSHTHAPGVRGLSREDRELGLGRRNIARQDDEEWYLGMELGIGRGRARRPRRSDPTEFTADYVRYGLQISGSEESVEEVLSRRGGQRTAALQPERPARGEELRARREEFQANPPRAQTSGGGGAQEPPQGPPAPPNFEEPPTPGERSPRRLFSEEGGGGSTPEPKRGASLPEGDLLAPIEQFEGAEPRTVEQPVRYTGRLITRDTPENVREQVSEARSQRVGPEQSFGTGLTPGNYRHVPGVGGVREDIVQPYHEAQAQRATLSSDDPIRVRDEIVRIQKKYVDTLQKSIEAHEGEAKTVGEVAEAAKMFQQRLRAEFKATGSLDRDQFARQLTRSFPEFGGQEEAIDEAFQALVPSALVSVDAQGRPLQPSGYSQGLMLTDEDRERRMAFLRQQDALGDGGGGGRSPFGGGVYRALLARRIFQYTVAPVAAQAFEAGSLDFVPPTLVGEEAGVDYGTLQAGFLGRQAIGRQFLSRGALQQLGGFLELDYALSGAGRYAENLARFSAAGQVGLGIATSGAELGFALSLSGDQGLARFGRGLSRFGIGVGTGIAATGAIAEGFNVVTGRTGDDALTLGDIPRNVLAAIYGTSAFIQGGAQGDIFAGGQFPEVAGGPLGFLDPRYRRSIYQAAEEQGRLQYIPETVRNYIGYQGETDEVARARQVAEQVAGRVGGGSPESFVPAITALTTQFGRQPTAQELTQFFQAGRRAGIEPSGFADQLLGLADLAGYRPGDAQFQQLFQQLSQVSGPQDLRRIEEPLSRRATLAGQLVPYSETRGQALDLIDRFGLTTLGQVGAVGEGFRLFEEFGGDLSDITGYDPGRRQRPGRRGGPPTPLLPEQGRFVTAREELAGVISDLGPVLSRQLQQLVQPLLGAGLQPDQIAPTLQAFGQRFEGFTPQQTALAIGAATGDLRAQSFASYYAPEVLRATNVDPAAARFFDRAGNPIIQTSGQDFFALGQARAAEGISTVATNLFGGLTGDTFQQAQQFFGGGVSGDLIQSFLDGGLRGAQAFTREQLFANQRASIGLGFARIAAQERYLGQLYPLEDQQRQLGYEFRQADFAAARERLDISNQFAVRQEDLSTRQLAFNQANRRFDLDFGYQGALLGREFQLEQRGFQDQLRGLSFGFQMEDLDEAIRFAGGRQRRQLIRQRDRLGLVQGIEDEQIQSQRDYQDELFAREDEQHQRRLDNIEQLEAFENEQLELTKERRQTFYDLDRENLERQIREYEQSFELQGQIIELNRAYQQEQLEFQKSALGLQAENLRLQQELDEVTRRVNEAWSDMRGELEQIATYDAVTFILQALGDAMSSASLVDVTTLISLKEFLDALNTTQPSSTTAPSGGGAGPDGRGGTRWYFN